MSSSNPRSAKGKGTGSERKKKKRRQQHHPEPRRTETAPHILAALEAQRARASQQLSPAPSQQPSAPATAAATTSAPPPPPPLPGYVFDPARNRFFRMVKDSLGTPGNARADNRTGVNASNHTSVRRKIKIPIVGGRNQGCRSPQRDRGGTFWGTSARGSGNNKHSDSLGSVVSATSARVGGPTVATSAGSVAPGERPSSCTPTSGGRGLHSFAMNSRRGLCGFGSRVLRSRRGVGGAVMPGGPERHHRAGVESVVSSSRFRLRGLSAWAHASPGAAYSAIEWDADRSLLAVGTISGALGVMTTGLESASGGGDPPRRGFAPWRSGARQDEERVCWATGASCASGQVSDIKFRTNGNEWACATASLGSAGQPGGIYARFWREGGQDGARDIVNFFSSARVCESKLRRGSVWCTEWDPLTPSRLAVGPSSPSPVAFFDVETQQLTPVAKLSGDVFSMCFLPVTAPGAGHAFVCGMRDGSVVLVDPRQLTRQNLPTTVARNVTSAGSGGGGGGGGSGSGRGSHSRSGGGRSADTELLARLDGSSVDHTQVLRDGTRCLVKDRSGGLQSVDLRFFSGRGDGPGRARGARPLKVLVPPGARARAPGRFTLDPTETVVVTPVPAAAAARTAGLGGGGGGSEAVFTGGAWNAFSSSGAAGLPLPYAAGCTSSGGVGINGGSTPFAGRDRLRILNVSSGEKLNDIQTPWTGVSLATERGTAAAAALGSGVSMSMPGSGDAVRFWGTGWEPGQGATVFEARLRSDPTGGGYGRL